MRYYSSWAAAALKKLPPPEVVWTSEVIYSNTSNSTKPLDVIRVVNPYVCRYSEVTVVLAKAAKKGEVVANVYADEARNVKLGMSLTLHFNGACSGNIGLVDLGGLVKSNTHAIFIQLVREKTDSSSKMIRVPMVVHGGNCLQCNRSKSVSAMGSLTLPSSSSGERKRAADAAAADVDEASAEGASAAKLPAVLAAPTESTSWSNYTGGPFGSAFDGGNLHELSPDDVDKELDRKSLLQTGA